MMLNSIGNYKRLILALVCGSMSYSTFAQVYSWRDANGAMHYSQFPRQIVEKNAAQSRASRKQADMDDVVNDLSPSKASNLLDGLDDIMANANVERQVDKVLTRRDPQLVLIEQQLARQQAEQLARQQAEQLALLVAKQQALKEQQALTVSILAQDKDLDAIAHVEVKFPREKTNKFLAGIQNKLKRQRQVESVAIVKTEPAAMVTVDTQLVEKSKTNNAFLAGIKKKLNRKRPTQVIDEPVIIANQNKVLVKSNIKPASKRNTSATVKNTELIQSADKIKAIESEISSSSNKADKVKAPSVKQINSALMLSRLSYNHNARLPLVGAGTNQLDRQGIKASSQFVNEVNRNAE
ncbi:DUF4124 domain-containing protein [Moritella marina ATCC 15381]|uniref:DUF4124 domain-containing protein n=1 Tax=Moritella marina ATCC 15381 TaxID=1202962 RepID=A0A5J6WSF1_MORMI|nr:DUF4124 domain-containing protein [Moritella marina]QFI40168.1 DUF4124 domain-containing protein [Moritella marina ATCC 15381]